RGGQARRDHDRGPDPAHAREPPRLSRGRRLVTRRGREGDGLPRRPGRLPGLQCRLHGVLLGAVPGAIQRRRDPAAGSPRRDRGGRAATLGRDLVGYGRQPPDPRWPGGARLALSFVLNYEEGGENTPLEGDPAAEAFLHEVVGASPTVGRRNLNTESMFEFGSRVGFWRVWRIFRRHGLPLTVYAVGQALERNPDAARAMVEAGWEIASHGWRWIDYGEMPEDEEREHVRRAIAAIERVTGTRPVGWYRRG